MTPANALLWICSAAAGLVLLRLALRWWRWLEESLYACQHYKIPRYDESLQENPLYRKAAAYISSLPSLEDSDYANIFSSTAAASKKKIGGDHLSLQLEEGRTVRDSFLGAPISWTNLSNAALVIRVRRRDKRRILRPYLNHVESVAEEIQLRRRELRLYTNSCGGSGGRRWRSAPFSHPSTLETVAMDAELKNRVRTDLESFLKNRSYYHRLGRVWKRSYLLYGPPGTGKSTFAAAMARFLCYDLYDLDLAGCSSNGGDLKDLLLQTTPQSVIVVEDLDRHLRTAAAAPSPESSLAGILNFMDGIFSCCGEERVMVFTMSGLKERVDTAVLRPGRLDVHIHFPLCNFPTFKTMASSYLGLKDHKLYPQVEEIFDGGASLSQAEIGEIMISNRGSTSRALKMVITALREQQKKQPVPPAPLPQVSGTSERMSAVPLGKISDGGSWLPPPEEHAEAGSEGGTLKEIRKLYGLIKLRSGSRKEGGGGSPPSEAPLAAAAVEKEITC